MSKWQFDSSTRQQDQLDRNLLRKNDLHHSKTKNCTKTLSHNRLFDKRSTKNRWPRVQLNSVSYKAYIWFVKDSLKEIWRFWIHHSVNYFLQNNWLKNKSKHVTRLQYHLHEFHNPCLCFQSTSSQRLSRDLGLISLVNPKNEFTFFQWSWCQLWKAGKSRVLGKMLGGNLKRLAFDQADLICMREGF